MASITQICNLALSHLGVGKELSNVDTDKGEEASACRRFFELSRDATLGDFAWPFANKFAALGLIEEDPTEEWAFSYAYPSDCLRLIRIIGGIRNDNRQTRVPFKIGNSAATRLIYTDADDAEVEYTVRVEDPIVYPADFTLALSLRIASYIAPRVTGGDPFKLGERALRLYLGQIDQAKASALNEMQVEEDPQSEFVRARE